MTDLPALTHEARHERIQEFRAVIPDLARQLAAAGVSPTGVMLAGLLMQAAEEYAALLAAHDEEARRRLAHLNAGGRPSEYEGGTRGETPRTPPKDDWQVTQRRDGRVINVSGHHFPTKSAALGYLSRHSRSYRAADGWGIENHATGERSSFMLDTNGGNR